MAHISEGYDPDKVVIIGGCSDAGLTIAKAISAMPKAEQFVIAENTERATANPPSKALMVDDIDMPFRSKILAEGMTMAALLSMAAMSGMMPRSIFPKNRPRKKCLLPECEEQTNHRGGYCCAEHCKKHRKKL